MREIMNSLSLESGALVVAVASSVMAVAWARIRTTALKWLLALCMPLVLANCLYWSSVWLGALPYEYATWAPLFILPWYAAGTVASAVVVFFLTRKRGANRNQQPR
jgi:hypothetical protein